MLEKLNEKLQQGGLDLAGRVTSRLSQHDASDLDGSYDVVVAAFCLHHAIAHLDSILCHLSKAVAVQGRLCLFEFANTDRSADLWKKKHAHKHGHGHSHGEDHGHGHGQQGHKHGHDHAHSHGHGSDCHGHGDGNQDEDHGHSHGHGHTHGVSHGHGGVDNGDFIDPERLKGMMVDGGLQVESVHPFEVITTFDTTQGVMDCLMIVGRRVE
eukprot:jgi/Mesvir1/2439/Mv22169-RA.1